MARIILFVVLTAALVAVVGWFATEPGSVILTFRGWRVETSVGVLTLAAAALVIALLAIFRIVAAIFGAPGRVRAWRRARRMDGGLQALARGMVAVAAGEPRIAQREAKRADRLLEAAPLTLLLSAQAAQLQGDEKAAENYFREMLGRPDTEFLGLRGLLLQAGRAGDSAAALAYAERAAELEPDSPWVQRSLFELSVKSRLWGEAERALRLAVRRGAIERDVGARHRAALLMQQSVDAEARGFAAEARNLARKVRRARPGFVPGALRFAALERDAGRLRAARRVLERAWRSGPHRELAAAYGALAEAAMEGKETGEDADDASAVEKRAQARLNAAKRLVDLAPGHPEGHLAAAEAALDARLWGEARAGIERARAAFAEGKYGPVPARLYRLLARSEEEGNGDAAAAARWLAEAGTAAADERWICGECGHGFAAWTPSCPACQAFDALDWGRPEPLAVIEPGPSATGPAAPIPPSGPAPRLAASPADDAPRED